MLRWTADFVNDPNNDFELIVEIFCNDDNVAVIRQGDLGRELIFYAHNENLVIPFNWLIGLMNEFNKRMESDLSRN